MNAEFQEIQTDNFHMYKRWVIARTPFREYTIVWASQPPETAYWRAQYRPINPKTGEVWQASRWVGVEGCYRFANEPSAREAVAAEIYRSGK